MPQPTVVFLGDFSADRIDWDHLARHLGWSIQRVLNLHELRELRERTTVSAVFIDWDAELNNGPMLLSKVRGTVPQARLVVCYQLARPILAEELVALGAFHSVPKPLDTGEVRQSIGFIWEAWSRGRNTRATPIRLAHAS